jgi:hypothetical protein
MKKDIENFTKNIEIERKKLFNLINVVNTLQKEVNH